MIIFYVVSLLLIVADQMFKLVINNTLVYETGNEINVIDGFFRIVNVRNTGAAWGVFSNGTLILTIISSIAVIIIGVLISRCNSKFLNVIMSFLLAGAAGNLIDRIRLQYVTDYLSFNIFGYEFPVFNLADMCVVCGSIMLFIYVIFIYKDGQRLFKVWDFKCIRKK